MRTNLDFGGANRPRFSPDEAAPLRSVTVGWSLPEAL